MIQNSLEKKKHKFNSIKFVILKGQNRVQRTKSARQPNPPRNSQFTQVCINLGKKKNGIAKITFKSLNRKLISSSIESCVHKDLEELLEEGKVLIMSRLFNREYQNTYVRDQNGYIKPSPKL